MAYIINKYTGKFDATGGGVVISATTPTTTDSMFWYNTTDYGLYFYAENQWQLIATMVPGASTIVTGGLVPLGYTLTYP